MSSAAPFPGLVTISIKEVGGVLQIYNDVTADQPLALLRGRFNERRLNPASILYIVPETQWAAAKANPSAFIAENDPADDEAPVEANMRLLAVAPSPQEAPAAVALVPLKTVLLHRPAVHMASPSKQPRGKGYDDPALFSVSTAGPMSVTGAATTELHKDFLSERSLYRDYVRFLPDFMTVDLKGGEGGEEIQQRKATSLFGKPEEFAAVPMVKLAFSSQPELPICAKKGETRLPLVGEVKLFQSVAFNQLISNALLASAKLFPSALGDPEAPSNRFYTKPPAVFGILGASKMAQLVVLEWAGKFFMSAYSEPFTVASSAHQAALRLVGTHSPSYGEGTFVELDTDLPCWAACDIKGFDVSWTVAAVGGHFYKRISSCAYDDSKEGGADYLRRLYSVYTAFSRAFASAPCEQLCDAKLLYGQYAVVVQMPFVAGRHDRPHPSATELASGVVVTDVASALVWLARRGFVYTDLRPENIIVVDSGRAVLIDYDDVRLCEPLSSFESLCAARKASPGLLVADSKWGSVWKEVRRLFGEEP